MYTKTEEEHKFTSTGVKFWRHMDKMNSYLDDSSSSIISTHVSPEGSCNLNCSYCSVKKRKKHFRIELDVMKDYITKLCSRGLKAVIITGGGEPTLYPDFNELVEWIKYDKQLSVALITNGTLSDRVGVWEAFSWVRVSLNDFEDWEDKIFIPSSKLDEESVLGCSFIYVGQSSDTLKKVSRLANKLKARYIRVLPNCLWDQEELLVEHAKVKNILHSLNDPLFFHQFKIHGVPKSKTCHQAYFRPYLSEVGGGTVYPCDSLVLNDACEQFDEQYQICKAGEVLDFLDGKIEMKFDLQKMCTGCVFADNVDMLDEWKKTGIIKNDFSVVLKHEEFV